MTQLLKRAFAKRLRRRPPREAEDPCAVFRAFIHVLAQMRARAGAQEKA